MRRSLKRESFYKDFQSQCIYLLHIWIYEYLERHNLKCLEIDYGRKLVFCFHKDSKNMLEDYFSFNYTNIDLFD